MEDSLDSLKDIIKDVQTLIEKSVDKKRGIITFSPEVAALFTGTGGVPVDPLSALAEEVRKCVKCPLHRTRTQTVFGTGNPRAQLMFVGEAPGADEDRMGEPFVGAAGQLLTQIIEKGMQLKRSDVYICNVLKCRPPNNRDPRNDEIEQCREYLFRQIEMVKPKVICALGAHAARTLLRLQESTSRMRGKWHFYGDIPVRVTFHPSYLLRCREDKAKEKEEKRKVWDDIQAVMRVLSGEEKPVREDISNDILWKSE